MHIMFTCFAAVDNEEADQVLTDVEFGQGSCAPFIAPEYIHDSLDQRPHDDID